jgi:hypothetical protein
MQHADSLWDYAHARRGDPRTSHDAARSLKYVTDAQSSIIDLFREFGPMTDEQVWERLRGRILISPSGARTRRHELVEAGLLVDSGERARTLANRHTIVWRLA